MERRTAYRKGQPMNDKQIVAFETALVVDGWSKEVSSNIREYKRDGLTVLVAQMQNGLDINIWGDDDMAIDPPDVYDFAELKRRMSVCSKCGAVGETVRLGFAGRVCPMCRTKFVAEVEYPGWCN